MEKMKKPQEGRYMGFYMDSASPKTLYRRVYNGTYFVDKSMMLKEIFKYIDATIYIYSPNERNEYKFVIIYRLV